MAAERKTPADPPITVRKKQSTKPRLISSKLAYKGKVFSVVTDKVEGPGGRIHGPAITLERHYRHAAGRFLIELPAGRCEPHEPPLAAAKREMIEETGYRAK